MTYCITRVVEDVVLCWIEFLLVILCTSLLQVLPKTFDLLEKPGCSFDLWFVNLHTWTGNSRNYSQLFNLWECLDHRRRKGLDYMTYSSKIRISGLYISAYSSPACFRVRPFCFFVGHLANLSPFEIWRRFFNLQSPLLLTPSEKWRFSSLKWSFQKKKKRSL